MICNKKHRFNKILKSFPDGQDNQHKGRHVCAGCAYEKGVRDGLDNNPRMTSFSSLNISQAGEGRHKDPLAIYKAGYDLGQEISN